MANQDIQEARVQFIDTQRKILKKELEKIVLDVMSHPSEVPEDIFELMAVAQQNGFSDIYSGFKEIMAEIGMIQAGKAIGRRKNQNRKLEEKALQDYFISNNGQRLGQIEEGLAYIASEKTIRAGRLDILAQDNQGKEVKIELKARDYDSRAVFFQLMKYFHDGNSRMIFITPEIKPDLILALTGHVSSGKMSFFRVEKSNGDYTLTKVNPQDISQPAVIDWTKRKRKQNGSFVRVTSGLPRAKKAVDVEETNAKVEWESLLTYEKIQMAFFPEIKLQPVEIPKVQLRNLEGLVYSLEEISSINWSKSPNGHTDVHVRNQRESRALSALLSKEPHATYNWQSCKNLMGFLCLSTNFDDKNDFGEIVTELKNCVDGIDADLKRYQYGEDAKIARSILKRFRHKQPEAYFKLSKSLQDRKLKGSIVLAQYARKLERVVELRKCSEDLARIYLKFTPPTMDAISLKEEVKEVHAKQRHFEEYVVADNELFKSLLQFLKPNPENHDVPTSKAQTSISIQSQPSVAEINTESISETRYSAGSIVPLKTLNGPHISDGMRIRVNAFVDEVLNNEKYSLELREQLAQKARRSRWYAKDLSDAEVIDAFDEWTINAAKL